MLALTSSLCPATAQTCATSMLDVGAGGQGNDEVLDNSGIPIHIRTISSDGSRAVFMTRATNLVLADTTSALDVYMRDVSTSTTVLVSATPAPGAVAGNGASLVPTISSDGAFVAFESDATNLVSPASLTSIRGIFRRDLGAGTTTLVSVNGAGAQANSLCFNPSISSDGRYVAFDTAATNLGAGGGNTTKHVYVRDTQLNTTTMVSVSSGGSMGNDDSAFASISADGTKVAFQSFATNLGSASGASKVILRNLTTGTTTFLAEGSRPCLSSDGGFVAFQATDAALPLGPSNGISDAFVRDIAAATNHRVSVNASGEQANATCYPYSISVGGRFVAFTSYASNLVLGDSAGFSDVFVHDRLLATTTRKSLDSTGGEPNADSFGGSLTDDGRYVVFGSEANDLATDSGSYADLFLRDCTVPSYAVYCFGDGSGTACPCANNSTPGLDSGCLNSVGNAGKLVPTGAADVSSDTMLLSGSGMLPGGAALFFQGTSATVPATAFNDGLMCVGGTLVRLSTKFVDASGLASFPGSGDFALSVEGGVSSSGATHYYQIEYRNAVAFCTAGTLNTTNGVSVVWVP